MIMLTFRDIFVLYNTSLLIDIIAQNPIHESLRHNPTSLNYHRKTLKLVTDLKMCKNCITKSKLERDA